MNLRLLKIVTSVFFMLPGIWGIVFTLVNEPRFWLRDFIIFAVLSSPLLVNKRAFYFGFGFVTFWISVMMTLAFILFGTPSHTTNSPVFYGVGIFVFSMAIAASITMIYIGTHTNEKGKFRLV